MLCLKYVGNICSVQTPNTCINYCAAFLQYIESTTLNLRTTALGNRRNRRISNFRRGQLHTHGVASQIHDAKSYGIQKSGNPNDLGNWWTFIDNFCWWLNCWSFLYICSCKNVKDHNKRSNLKMLLPPASKWMYSEHPKTEHIPKPDSFAQFTNGPGMYSVLYKLFHSVIDQIISR